MEWCEDPVVVVTDCMLNFHLTLDVQKGKVFCEHLFYG